jgi:uncharacterized protein (TIGR02145 family)
MKQKKLEDILSAALKINPMKKIFVILTLFCFGAIQAQPQKINYQAVAVNASGITVKNRVISLRLSILDSSSTGSVLYSETHQPTTDGIGQFSVYLGGGTAVSGAFSNIPWGNTKDKFLKAEADLAGGMNYVLMGVSQVVSVPYALQASSLKEGATITGANGSQYTLTVGTNGPVWACFPPTTQANAGANQLNVCGNIVTLSGNTAAGMTPTWRIISGTGGSIISNTFTGIRGNAYNLRYSLANACGTTDDTLQISFALPTTLAIAGPDQLSLAGTTATLAANSPTSGETGTWTILTGNGAILNNSNSPSATFTKGTDSVYLLEWTIFGYCGISRDTVKVSFQNQLVMNVPCPGVTTVTYAGENYPTVQIGTQCWFAKNLNVGTIIQGTNNQTNNSILEKYCYDNVPANCSTYGGLYQWAEAVQYQNGASNSTSLISAFTGNVRGICPTGWHLPSDAEYCTITKFLDTVVNCLTRGPSGTIAGGKMKSVSGLWTVPNTGATNLSGFSALPGGFRENPGNFYQISVFTAFWTSDESSNNQAVERYFTNSGQNFGRNYYFNKSYGFSVRCLKD